MRAERLLFSSGHTASLAPARLRFLRASRDPLGAQRALAARWLARSGDSAYGRAHGLDRVHDLEGLRRRAPVVSWDAVRPWVERAARGEDGVLSRAPLLAFEPTSGSTGGNKLIPLTKAFLQEMSAATGPWLFELSARRPALLGARAYWSISPAGEARPPTPGGHRVGLEDDTEYFGPLARRALRALMAVPGELARLPDVDAWRRATLEHLLGADDLGFVSVWSPSFLTVLMRALQDSLPELLGSVLPKRRADIEAGLERAGRVTGPALWPRLRVISCWTHGPAASFLPELRRWFPGVELQPKGLLATEGVVSFPLGPPGRTRLVPAVASHVLELTELSRGGRTVLAHEAEPGGEYAPVLSTGAGLCRYQLRDRVRCEGRSGGLPELRFIEKLDGGVDLVGEKLAVRDAARAIEAASDGGERPRFALLAPTRRPHPGYRVYLEGATDPERFAAAVERALGELHHYGHARRLGQLAPVRAVVVHDGARRYLDALAARGVRLGDAKPTPLHAGEFWSEVFPELGKGPPS